MTCHRLANHKLAFAWKNNQTVVLQCMIKIENVLFLLQSIYLKEFGVMWFYVSAVAIITVACVCLKGWMKIGFCRTVYCVTRHVQQSHTNITDFCSPCVVLVGPAHVRFLYFCSWFLYSSYTERVSKWLALWRPTNISYISYYVIFKGRAFFSPVVLETPTYTYIVSYILQTRVYMCTPTHTDNISMFIQCRSAGSLFSQSTSPACTVNILLSFHFLYHAALHFTVNPPDCIALNLMWTVYRRDRARARRMVATCARSCVLWWICLHRPFKPLPWSPASKPWLALAGFVTASYNGIWSSQRFTVSL